ncbi:HNH endonuclease-domain-containing protein [Tuber brumale]|nr:HNH endonuclease-domain-containing protein [Tuber brumale]
MSHTRSGGRNLTFYNSAHPAVVLGGLVQNGSITEANFLDMFGILLVVEGGPLHVHARITGQIISRTEMTLRTGAYEISCQGMYYILLRYQVGLLLILSDSIEVSVRKRPVRPGSRSRAAGLGIFGGRTGRTAFRHLQASSDIFGNLQISSGRPGRLRTLIEVSDEPWFHRLTTNAVTGREERFRNEIRHRDQKCVISGVSNAEHLIAADMWAPFEAAHIFPLRHETLWIRYNYGRWITDMEDIIGSSKIHSTQNGFLLQATLHKLFNQYLTSVNPDDGYKVVVFTADLFRCDGRILDPVCRNPTDPHRIAPELLRWHFSQSVLANMRGAGEPIMEHGFPPGTDMAGKKDTNPTMQNIDHGGPLVKAAKAGKSESVRWLLRLKRVNPDKADEHTRTPLSCVARMGYDEVVQILLGCDDVNPNTSDSMGPTPLLLAAVFLTVPRALQDPGGLLSRASWAEWVRKAGMASAFYKDGRPGG